MTALQALAAELANSAYAGLTDADAAAAVNAKTFTQPVPLAAAKLLLYQDATPSAILRIAAAAMISDAASGMPGLQVAARQANAYLNDPHMRTIDFGNPIVAAGMALLIEGGIISQSLADAAAALGAFPWRKTIGYFAPLTAAQVTAARALNAG